MDVALLSAVDQLAFLREGRISVVELAEEHIRRIESIDPLLNAFVDFDADRVRQQARENRDGRLSGLCVTVKSSIEVAGHRCEIGSLLRRGTVATSDAEAVARLRREGAIILGTTNCPEFLMAYETDNLLDGRTNNPWDTRCSAGGSSGGEAAAVAAGLSAAGIGSDSGGSVREPAHFTGICALKPTPGRVPAIGHMPPCVGPFSSLGAVGPMARTIADVTLLFQVLSGRHAIDPTSAPVPYRGVTLEAAKAAPIAWFEDDGIFPVTPETRAAVREAVGALEQAGFRVEQFRPEGLEAARKLWEILFVQCGAMFYEATVAGQRDRLSPIFSGFLETAESKKALTAEALLQAWADTDLLRSRMLVETARWPILLMPVCAVPAFRHGERAWEIDSTRVGYWDAMRYTQWFNLLAWPAAVVPVGRSPEGLPIGVQIAGRPYEDERVLAVAAVLDRAFGYRVPPVS